jgi:hypothetical protein
MDTLWIETQFRHARLAAESLFKVETNGAGLMLKSIMFLGGYRA